MRRTLELHFRGGMILIAQREAFPAGLRHYTAPNATPGLLLQIANNPALKSQLASGWRQLPLPRDALLVSDRDMLAALEREIAGGRLMMMFAPGESAAPAPKADAEVPGAKPWAAWTAGDKLAHVLSESLDHVGPALREQLEQLIEPTNIAMTVGTMAALAASQAVPVVGQALAAVLVTYAYASAGLTGIQKIGEMITVIAKAMGAKRPEDLAPLAKALGGVLAVLGLVFLQRFLRRVQAKEGGSATSVSEKGGGGSRNSVSSNGGGVPPPAPPKQPVKLRPAPPTRPVKPSPGPAKPPAQRYERPPAASMDNKQARNWYHSQEDRIPDIIDKNAPKELQARQAFEFRNEIRTAARDAMSDRDAAAKLMREDPNLTWPEIIARKKKKGLSGDAIYDDILGSASKSRESVDAKLGIKRKGK